MWKQLSKTEEGLAVIRQGCPLCLLPNHVRPDTKELCGPGLHKRCSLRSLEGFLGEAVRQGGRAFTPLENALPSWALQQASKHSVANTVWRSPLQMMPRGVRWQVHLTRQARAQRDPNWRGLDRARFLQTMPTRSLIWNMASDAHRGSEKKTFILMQWVTFVLGKNRFPIKIEMMYPHMFVKNKSILLRRKVIRVLLPSFIPTVRPQWLDYNSDGHGGPSLNTWEWRIKYKCYIKFTIYYLIYTY